MQQHPVHSPLSRQDRSSRRRFADAYEQASRRGRGEDFMGPLRQEVTRQARGVVLEVGAGNGLNFAFYPPGQVERVEAIEPDATMLEYARVRAQAARVPIELVQAAVEQLPYADESFDSVVVTLVFCSVSDPLRGLHEVRRVLKPGGILLMVEHVRAQGAIAATIQDLVTPLTRLMLGNCHWNRDTEKTVISAGFEIEQRRRLSWSMMPFVVLRVTKEIPGSSSVIDG